MVESPQIWEGWHQVAVRGHLCLLHTLGLCTYQGKSDYAFLVNGRIDRFYCMEGRQMRGTRPRPFRIWSKQFVSIRRRWRVE